MEIIIKGTPKEIADLALEVQGQPVEAVKTVDVDFDIDKLTSDFSQVLSSKLRDNVSTLHTQL